MAIAGNRDLYAALPKLLEELAFGEAGFLNRFDEVSRVLESLIKRTVDQGFREDLAWPGAVQHLLASMQTFFRVGDAGSDGPLGAPEERGLGMMLLVTKLLRNLCAGVTANQDAFRVWDGVGTMAEVTGWLLVVRSGSAGYAVVPVVEFLTLILQVLGNFANSGEENQVVVWRTWFPELLLLLSQLDEAKVYDPLCMLLFTCCRSSVQRSSDLSSVGSPLLAALLGFAEVQLGYGGLVTLSSPVLDTEGGREGVLPAYVDASKRDVHVWLELLLSLICFDLPLLAHAFVSLGSSRPGVADADNASGREGDSNEDLEPWKRALERMAFSKTQAILLGTLCAILHDRVEGNLSSKSQFSCDSATFLVDLIRVAAQGKHFQGDGSTLASDILRFGLFLVRELFALESEDCAEGGLREGERSVTVMHFLSARLPGLMVQMLDALGPPEAIRAHSGAALCVGEDLEPPVPRGTPCGFVRTNPYPGYRRDIVGVLANMSYQNRQVQDEIRRSGGLLVVLQQCVSDKENTFLREWGYWAVRNILAGNEENQRIVEELEVKEAVNTEEVHNMGFSVEMNTVTGRPKLVNRLQEAPIKSGGPEVLLS